MFSDGATQVFEADGGTTYVESGRPDRGEWYVADDGRFGSFWPPNYRASYDLRWTVQDGAIVGLRFTELDPGAPASTVTTGTDVLAEGVAAVAGELGQVLVWRVPTPCRWVRLLPVSRSKSRELRWGPSHSSACWAFAESGLGVQ